MVRFHTEQLALNLRWLDACFAATQLARLPTSTHAHKGKCDYIERLHPLPTVEAVHVRAHVPYNIHGCTRATAAVCLYNGMQHAIHSMQHARLYESYSSRLSLQRHATYNTQHATCTVVRELPQPSVSTTACNMQYTACNMHGCTRATAAVCLYNGMQHTIHSMQHAPLYESYSSRLSLQRHATYNTQHATCKTYERQSCLT